MKKTLILLSLIYFVSCEISCMGTDNIPENHEDCYNRGLENEKEDVCFYLKIKTPEVLSTCVELPNALNKELAKKMLISQYSQLNYSLEDFSCPTKKKEDDTSSNVWEFKIDPEKGKDCFGLTLKDEKNNYCWYMKVSIDGISQSVCREFTKEIPANDIKQKLIEEMSVMNAQLDEFECPS